MPLGNLINNDSDAEIIIGIDPGNTGGICAISSLATVTQPIAVAKMPIVKSRGKTLAEVDVMALREWIWATTTGKPFSVFIECPPDHLPSISTMRSMGIAYGMIRATILCLQACQKCVPVVSGRQNMSWQRRILGTVGKGLTKQAALKFATKSFPNEVWPANRKGVPHDGIIDAACIACYGRAIVEYKK